MTVPALALDGVIYYVDPVDPFVVCNAPQMADGTYEVAEWSGGVPLRGSTDLFCACPSVAAQDRYAAARLLTEGFACTYEEPRAVAAARALAQATERMTTARAMIVRGEATDLGIAEMMAPMRASIVQVDPDTLRVVS